MYIIFFFKTISNQRRNKKGPTFVGNWPIEAHYWFSPSPHFKNKWESERILLIIYIVFVFVFIIYLFILSILYYFNRLTRFIINFFYYIFDILFCQNHNTKIKI